MRWLPADHGFRIGRRHRQEHRDREWRSRYGSVTALPSLLSRTRPARSGVDAERSAPARRHRCGPSSRACLGHSAGLRPRDRRTRRYRRSGAHRISAWRSMGFGGVSWGSMGVKWGCARGDGRERACDAPDGLDLRTISGRSSYVHHREGGHPAGLALQERGRALRSLPSRPVRMRPGRRHSQGRPAHARPPDRTRNARISHSFASGAGIDTRDDFDRDRAPQPSPIPASIGASSRDHEAGCKIRTQRGTPASGAASAVAPTSDDRRARS